MERIDILNEDVVCFDINSNILKQLKLNQFQDVDFSYLDGAKLFSININQPIKRAVKFSEINGLNTTAQWVEYPYTDMTPQQQADFDSFINQTKNL
jgi:hypothetical protein